MRCFCFRAFTLLSGIFGKFSRQWVLNTPYCMTSVISLMARDLKATAFLMEKLGEL